MKHTLVTTVLCSMVFASCDWAKDKAKDTVHKTGEIVAKTGSEFADGVAKGVEESFSNMVSLSGNLGGKGVKLGKVKITGTDSTTDNILTAYIIFDKNYDGKISAKAIDEDGQEFGRASVKVQANQGDAKYLDFVFDNRTNIDRKDKILLD